MNRRFFFSALSAIGLGALVPKSVAAEPIDKNYLHALYRLEKGQWIRRRMKDLSIGDKFRMEPNENAANADTIRSSRIMTVGTTPSRNPSHPDPDGGWECNAIWQDAPGET
jgi:hypothetical protein